MSKSRKQIEASAKNTYVWRHNSLIGQSVMMQAQAKNVINAPSTSEASKAVARVILEQAKALENTLRNIRIDPND